MATDSPIAETPIKRTHTFIDAQVKKTLDFSTFPSPNSLQLERLIEATKALCKRKDGSIWHNHLYQSLEEFDNDAIWKEMITHIPFFMEVLNTITVGNQVTSQNLSDIPKSLRIKFVTIYCILMNERWHELSLFQRVTSVLMIEGGCTKEVSIIFSLCH